MKKRKRVIRKGTTKNKIHRAIKKQTARKGKGPAPKALVKKSKSKPPAINRTKPKTRRLRAVAPPPREVGLLDAIGEVIADVEELGQEMRDWADNMEEKFGSTQKYEDVNTAADALENIAGEDPQTGAEIEKFLNQIMITVQDPTPRRQPRSRATRLDDARSVLRQVADKLEDPALLVVADAPLTEEQKDVCSTMHSALEDMESEMEDVQFPGMFG